jgi:vacuolar-type H+-ATPase subunit F/Vma7
MTGIVAIGDQERLRGFALAGVEVTVADDPAGTRAAWAALPPEVALVILTPGAHAALAESELDPREQRLWVVMPG